MFKDEWGLTIFNEGAYLTFLYSILIFMLRQVYPGNPSTDNYSLKINTIRYYNSCGSMYNSLFMLR